MLGYNHNVLRPNKWRTIADAINAGFALSALSSLYERGVVYYTLGGEMFNDVKLMYNIFGEHLETAISYEQKAAAYKTASAAALSLCKDGDLANLDLKVLQGDILQSDLDAVPRNKRGLIVFLDLTQFLSFSHREIFQRWIVGKALVPGDVLYLTSSMPPWALVKKSFVEELSPILIDLGANENDLADRVYWKTNYVHALVRHFADEWRFRQLSHQQLRHFFCRVYRDTRFEMATNGFVVV